LPNSASPRSRRLLSRRLFYQGKIATAQFYASHVLSQAPGLAHAVVHGAAGTLAETAL
jgi:hypothetical protein